LPRHGLHVVPYGGGVTFMENGEDFGDYTDHGRQYRDLKEMSVLGKAFLDMGEEGLSETLKFWTKSAADFVCNADVEQILLLHRLMQSTGRWVTN
jgi:hypothetical protein